jgi:hypothetical protein
VNYFFVEWIKRLREKKVLLNGLEVISVERLNVLRRRIRDDFPMRRGEDSTV